MRHELPSAHTVPSNESCLEHLEAKVEKIEKLIQDVRHEAKDNVKSAKKFERNRCVDGGFQVTG